MKAINVSRVSTEEQKEAGNSLPAQIERIDNYCRKKNFETIKSFSFDESAYKDKRDEFDKLLEYVQDVSKKDKVAVCFDKVDRLSRSVFDKRVASLYEMALADKIELHFVSEGQIINNQMSAVEKFQFGMSLGLAKYYSDAIGDNVKRAYEQMRRSGQLTGKPPIGYMSLYNENGERTDVVPDSKNSHLIVKMFELYATGNYSLEVIRTRITELGLRSMNGNVLSKSCIENILKNSFYCGTAFSKKLNIYWPHNYSNLITRELFDKCQDVRDIKRKKLQKVATKNYIFKGLLSCHKCGCSMTPEIKKEKFVYYSCTNAKRICKRVYIPEKTLLEPILDVLRRFEGISEETQNLLVAELRRNTESEVSFHKAQITRIRNEYEKLKQKDDRLLEVYLDREITKDVYDTKHEDYNSKLNLLNLELEEHTKGDYDYQTTVASVFSIARRSMQIFESSEVDEKRQFINYLIQNPTVSGKKLDFTIASPFNLVLELSSRPMLLGYKDSNLDTMDQNHVSYH